MIVLSVANRKGGVGKTTLALALATRLAERERVLLVDLDSQANATESLNIPLAPEVSKWLQFGEMPRLASRGQLDVIAGDDRTRFAELALGQLGVRVLEQLVKPLTQYGWVILDCPPSISAVTRNAVYAADYVLCPTIPEYLSVAGVRQLVKLIDEMREAGASTQLMAIQPNKTDWRTNEHKIHLRSLIRAFGAWEDGGLVWPALRQSIAVAEASAEGRPIWETLRGKAAIEWGNVVERVRRYGKA